MSKPRLHRHQIVWQRQQQKDQRKQSSPHHAPLQHQSKPQQSAHAQKAIAQLPQELIRPMSIGSMRRPIPEKQKPIQRPLRNPPRPSLNPLFRFLPAHLRKRNLAHPHILLILRVPRPKRHRRPPRKPIIPLQRRLVQLHPKIISSQHRRPHHPHIPHHPRRQHRSKRHASKHRPHPRRSPQPPPTQLRPHNPNHHRRQTKQQRSIRKRNHPPEDAEHEPEEQRVRRARLQDPGPRARPARRARQ